VTTNETAIIPAEEGKDGERFRLRGIGAGPFQVQEATEGERVRLVRNTSYFIPGEPNLDS
jgi:MarR-like DNA-binding transcriptional regulator SgrR of sgrS sRNA